MFCQCDKEDIERFRMKEESEGRRMENKIRVVKGGSLVEEGNREESGKERSTHSYHFTSFLRILWQVTEAILWWLSLLFGDGNYEGDARTQLPT